MRLICLHKVFPFSHRIHQRILIYWPEEKTGNIFFFSTFCYVHALSFLCEVDLVGNNNNSSAQWRVERTDVQIVCRWLLVGGMKRRGGGGKGCILVPLWPWANGRRVDLSGKVVHRANARGKRGTTIPAHVSNCPLPAL